MLQVRITNSDGTDAIILENAKDKSYSKVFNSSDEGLTFAIAKNDPKASVLNPDTTGYAKFWEVWETGTNQRKNYGPITSITEQGEDWRVEGAGVSSLLADFYKTTKTFYTPINTIISDLRFENLAIQPRTRTLIHNHEPSDSVRGGQQDYIFGDPSVNEETETFYNLSKASKDNAVDDNTGQFRIGEIEPPISYYTTDSYWSGTSTNDSLIVDLGDAFDISRIKMLFPWWGGAQRRTNRGYDFELAYANDTPVVQSISGVGDFSNFTPFYHTSTFTKGPWGSPILSSRTPTGNRIVTVPDRPYEFYIGRSTSGYGTSINSFYVGLNQDAPISARYIRARITNVRAWYGTAYDDDPSIDGWAYQCDPNYVNGDVPGINKVKGVMTGKTINDRVITNANDCHASIVEMGIYKEIIKRDVIKPLALQRIDNNNPQIIYSHSPAATETFNTSIIDGRKYRRFEPGSTFRRFSVTWSGATTTKTKFYGSDCTQCYPDGYNFGVVNQNNTMVFTTDDQSGSASVKSSVYTKHLIMRGSDTAVITSCDAWPATLDQLSWGGSYSFTRITNDTATIHFRGESFKWYATVPANETGATTRIEIRSRLDGSGWTGWSTLNAGLVLPSNINSEVVYEITYESGYLVGSTVYEIKLTNLGGYCSIDSIEGFWVGSYTDYNEDSRRLSLSQPANMIQLYDKRFTGGSLYKWNKKSGVSLQFEGDRAVIISARGRNHGKLRLLIFKYIDTAQYDPGLANHVMIPGGDADGSIEINLHTAKRGSEVPSAVIFDSNDYPDLLPWGRYSISLNYINIETYSATQADAASNNFINRCSNCNPAAGSRTINKWVYLDGIGVHEAVGLSVSFENETHLEILKSVAEATQTEWEVTTNGIRLEPRIGQDTEEVLREGQDTLVDFDIVNDISQMASMLISTGADIDGLPLFAVSEQKSTRDRLGRTVTRQQDFRNTADYFQLVGLSRTDLKRRAYPEKRITVKHVAKNLNLNQGDSFILYTRKMGPLRVRINRLEISESSSSGREYSLECVRWPPIT